MTTFEVGRNRIQLEHPAEATGASSIKEKRATLTSNTLQTIVTSKTLVL
jgi:hypothetical protein